MLPKQRLLCRCRKKHRDLVLFQQGHDQAHAGRRILKREAQRFAPPGFRFVMKSCEYGATELQGRGMRSCSAALQTNQARLRWFQKESPRAVPDFQFPRLLHANLTRQEIGKAWRDRGDKMAPKQIWPVLLR